METNESEIIEEHFPKEEEEEKEAKDRKPKPVEQEEEEPTDKSKEFTESEFPQPLEESSLSEGSLTISMRSQVFNAIELMDYLLKVRIEILKDKTARRKNDKAGYC